jgi:hypothetical protein
MKQQDIVQMNIPIRAIVVDRHLFGFINIMNVKPKYSCRRSPQDCYGSVVVRFLLYCLYRLLVFILQVVMHKFFKDRSYPQEQEGFVRVDVLPFSLQIPSPDTNPFAHRLYHMYLK